MTAWDIKPEGVQKVLADTHSEALKYQDLATRYGTAMEEVFDECGGIVGRALSQYATHFQHAFSDISAQVIASLNGAADATVAYMNGQHDMALAAQRNSRDAGAKEAAAREQAPGDAAGAGSAESVASIEKSGPGPAKEFLGWLGSLGPDEPAGKTGGA